MEFLSSVVNDYYWVVLGLSILLFVVSLFTRLKKAKLARDKRIFTIYSVVTGVLTVLLVIYKVGA